MAEAFWKIKDSLRNAYDSLTNGDKDLCFFDLEAKSTAIGVTFSVNSYFIINKYGLWGCSKTFTEDPEHAWYVKNGFYIDANNLPTYFNGQCDIDHVTKTAYNINNTLPGAASQLRTYGLGNYNACVPMYPCGYYTDVETVWIQGGNNLVSPISDYSTIPGYGHNNDIWNAFTFYLSTTSMVEDDPDIVYKNYLTTPMMNFYLDKIPSYLISNVPSGKRLYDFHISYMYCLCLPFPPGTNNPWTVPALNYTYNYHITFGTFIRDCGFIGISSM